MQWTHPLSAKMRGGPGISRRRTYPLIKPASTRTRAISWVIAVLKAALVYVGRKIGVALLTALRMGRAGR